MNGKDINCTGCRFQIIEIAQGSQGMDMSKIRMGGFRDKYHDGQWAFDAKDEKNRGDVLGMDHDFVDRGPSCFFAAEINHDMLSRTLATSSGREIIMSWPASISIGFTPSRSANPLVSPGGRLLSFRPNT